MPIRTFKPEYILPGTRIGSYVVCSQIGQGSGAVVYDAVSSDGTHYALKVSRFPPSDDPADTFSMMAKRFARSVYCHTQLLSCPYVARMVAHDWHPSPKNGWPYLVQELVPGSLTITDWARENSPSLRQIVTAFQALALACAEMERADIQHRDLKPANILMTPEGMPKIVDFNSATYVRAEPLTYPAASGQPGTLIYQPPELCDSIIHQRTTGQEVPFVPNPAGDLHALGCILYEVLVGEHPYDIREDSLEQLREIAYRPTPIPQILNEGIPLGLTKVVMGLLRKDPADRYQHGDEVARDLQALLEVADRRWDWPFVVPRDQGPRHRLLRRRTDPALAVRTPTPSPRPRTSPAASPAPPTMARPALAPGRSRRWAWAALAGGLAAAGLGAGWWLLPEPSAPTVSYMKVFPIGPSFIPPLPENPPVNLPCPEGNFRVCDRRWFETCPEFARRAGDRLDPADGGRRALLVGGQNIIVHRVGCEIRTGPIMARAAIGQRRAARLLGMATADERGASVRFHTLAVTGGRRYPLCALGGLRGDWPHLDRIADYELPRPQDPARQRAGFTHVMTGDLEIHVASGHWPRVVPARLEPRAPPSEALVRVKQ
jgi:serine/threonine protein kinase